VLSIDSPGDLEWVSQRVNNHFNATVRDGWGMSNWPLAKGWGLDSGTPGLWETWTLE